MLIAIVLILNNKNTKNFASFHDREHLDIVSPLCYVHRTGGGCG